MGRLLTRRRRPDHRAERGELVPVPEEQQVVELAKELRKQGLSYREIGARLDDEGHRPRSGGHLHPPMVARLAASAAPPAVRGGKIGREGSTWVALSESEHGPR
jgi:hypothetical protein